MPTIIATPGAANANSYITLVEATAYFESRIPLEMPWEDVDGQDAALIMATRVLNAFVQPVRTFYAAAPTGGSRPYYLIRRQWTGAPTTTTQKLAWPRTGMYDMNGNLIADDVIPEELKFATAELAGQLGATDLTLDDSVRAAGIKSLSVSSVSITFKDMIAQHVLPDAVWLLMPSSWFTDERWEPVQTALFDVVSE